MGERKNGSSGVKGIISHPPSVDSRRENPHGQAACGSRVCERSIHFHGCEDLEGFFCAPEICG